MMAEIDQTGWLVAHGLAKSFGKRAVVRDVSIAVRRGEAVGLLGPNGAGKTTVFTMIMGLVRPDGGEVLLDGLPITHLPLYQRGRLGIGYLPQEASIFRGLSVKDNVLAVLEGHIKNKKERNARLDELLDEFSVSHLRDADALALSGGERRRVEIARALAADPKFMLLDEPFAGVDPIAVADIQGLVRQLTQRGIGVLITDHQVRETFGLVDRAYLIHGGKVMIQGRPETIMADPDARRVYLGESFKL
ncbi:LPS export ABC transporter ATP-binding protein [Pelagibacterium flavum]|uniref:LPS export ABC transporter ATP-binding protein n=1 Tax=Pelagibacterium flavum TaxID=2984530 RepID=A0ABY6IXW0_9HYPH|nr:LPS export ABC transporter ATP-binding protein [Pelagibacterium sp. YIM 151497]UYQ74172.1 LPS export ABC transporter ATP-binding protein [Pelagibacterium sp. YIM 151497]